MVADPAKLAVSSAAVDFGSIAVGTLKTTALTITNAKGATATVSNVNLAGAGFSFTTNPAIPFSLAAGQSAALNVTFDPAAGGTFNGSISLVVSGGPAPAPTTLTGTGLTSGQLGLTPTSMSFGSVTVGATQTQTGSLTAAGTSITVSSATWSGPGYSVSGITFPVTVPAGQSVPFTVQFAPKTAGIANGSVSFVSNATNSPDVESLLGTGANPHSVSLAWNASTSVVVGYNVYRGSQTGGPYTLLNPALQSGTTYADTNVVAGATYFYVVTAVDSNSVESAFSNETSSTVPTP